MAKYFVELEVGLQKIEGAFHVTLRFDRSDSEIDAPPILGLAAFDADAVLSGLDNDLVGSGAIFDFDRRRAGRIIQ